MTDFTMTIPDGADAERPSTGRRAPIGALPMTLRARRPGYAVMQECLRIQTAAPARTRAQRFWGSDPVVPTARSWFKGALGERRVGAELDLLGPAFTVLHAVPVGKGSTDIDHLVIGPTGVFSINTKNHSGQRVFVGGGSFMVGGARTSYMHAAQSEGQKATRLLSAAAGGPITVQPLLVVAADQIRFGKKRAPVVVLEPNQVRSWISELPQAHSDEAVQYLAMLAEDRGTWHAAAVVLDDTLRLEQRFDRLVREVEDARLRRRRVGMTVVIGAVGVAGTAFFALASAAAALLGG